MTDETVGTTAPAKRRGWLRAIACVLGLLIVLLVAVYFVATSGAFFKGVILPRVSKAMNAEVTVSDASISPFKQVILHNLKVQTTGVEPLVAVPEMRLRYSLLDIIGGNIRVDEVGLSSPTVTLVVNPDGSSNQDPIQKSQKAKAPEKKPEQPAKPPGAKPLQIDLKKFGLTDATIRQVNNYSNGTSEITELSHITVTLNDLKNGQAGKLALNADLRVQKTNGVLQARLGGSFALTPTADFKAASIKGSTRLDVTRSEGALTNWAAMDSELEVEVTPTEVKGVVLHFQKGDARLGELRVSGPFDMQKLEGRLSIVLAGIDKRLLNVAGAQNGMDFGGTTISSTNVVELAKGSAVITASGQLDVSKFQVTRTNQTTSQLDLRSVYNVTVDRGQSNAALHALTLTGLQDGKTLLKGELTSPMQISWGNVSNLAGDSALTLTVSDLNLADWKPLAGKVAPAGIVNAKMKVLSQQGGQELPFDFHSRIDHLTVNVQTNQFFRTNQITDATITLQASGKAEKLKQFSLTNCELEVARENRTLTTASASGTYDKASEAADMQVAVQAALAPVPQALAQTNMSISSGAVDLTAQVTQRKKTRTVTGNFALTDFSGRFGTNEVRGLGTTADFEVGIAPQPVQIHKLTGKVTQSGNVAGSYKAFGTYSRTYDSSATNAGLKATAQLALAPLLQAVPRPNMSVSSGTVDLEARLTREQEAQTVKGNLALTNFTGRFGKNEVRGFGTAAEFDVAITPSHIQLCKAPGKLTQGGNAAGSYDVFGTYDFVKTNANLTVKLTNFNQNVLGPFLEPMLADKKLVSVAINANAEAKYDPQGASKLKADLQMANLVVKDSKNRFPATPLEAKVDVDALLEKKVANVRQFQITLPPTARATTNQVRLSGKVDMSQTNAIGETVIKGNLKLEADSLDVTSYYDLFMGEKKASGAAGETAPASATAPAEANKGPEPKTWRLQDFAAEAAIRRFYLHEVEIADLRTTTKIHGGLNPVKLDGGHVVLDPFELTLNRAPVKTTLDLDLDVPGWKYNWSLSAQAIPLAPLVNSFQPESKGILSGTLTAETKLAGAGTNWPSLQKNLTGQFDMASTNLNLSVDNIQGNTFYTRLLKTLAKTITAIPDLAKNPGSAAASLLQGLVSSGSTGSSPGSSEAKADLAKSPINSIILRGTAGSGRVDLTNAVVQSPAFEAQAKGTITLAEVLTNSPIQIPVSVSLERSVAQRINMAGNTPTNATYAKLPDFLTMKGTLGNSKADINYVALASAALQGAGGKAGQAGGVLQSLSGFLPGGAKTNATSGTIPPAGSAAGIMQGLGGFLNKNTAVGTNKPATNAPPTKNPFKGLLGQ